MQGARQLRVILFPRLNKTKIKGNPIPVNDATYNWAVFGNVLKVRKCFGTNYFLERYKLSNGSGSYQEASWDYGSFHEISERSFRELLSRMRGFSDTAKTIKIYDPPFKEFRRAMFSQKTNSFLS